MAAAPVKGPVEARRGQPKSLSLHSGTQIHVCTKNMNYGEIIHHQLEELL